jgi:hypothetical protein
MDNIMDAVIATIQNSPPRFSITQYILHCNEPRATVVNSRHPHDASRDQLASFFQPGKNEKNLSRL